MIYKWVCLKIGFWFISIVPFESADSMQGQFSARDMGPLERLLLLGNDGSTLQALLQDSFLDISRYIHGLWTLDCFHMIVDYGYNCFC